MGNNKKLFTLLCLTGTLFVSMAAIIFANERGAVEKIRANNKQYTLNLTYFSEGTNYLTTTDGNRIEFLVSGFSNGIFSKGGYIRNVTPISGLQSMTINITTSPGVLFVEYDWFYDGTYASFSENFNASKTTSSFEDEGPTFFNLYDKNYNNLNVTNIEITYSCEVTEPVNKGSLSYTYNSSTDSYEVMASGKKQCLYDVVIPSVYNNKPVTWISSAGFQECTRLRSVVIPNSVTSIGGSAFFGCTGLTSITIPNSVTSIGAGTFSHCESLERVTLSNSLNTIEQSVFNHCHSLETITIPNSVASISDYAFQYCTSLNTINISSSLISVGEGAFTGCSSLEEFNIPSSLTSLGNNLFDGCSNLSNINVDENNPSYASVDGVLYNKAKTQLIQCPGNKTGAITIPSGVTSIPDYAFTQCEKITSVSLPNSIQSIGSSSFSGCSALASINIPNSVASISDYAFSNCSSLISVSGCRNVVEIGDNAFFGCKLLLEFVIPSGLTEINQSVFFDCNSLTSITIPSGITSIGTDAFSNCYRLTTIVNKSALGISTGSSENGKVAYYAKEVVNDESLSHLETDEHGFITYTSPSEVYLIGYVGSSAILDIPDDVTIINNHALMNIKSFTSVVLPTSVKEVGYRSFLNSVNEIVYYKGSSITEWQNIVIDMTGNYALSNATRYYYSENNPGISNQYWHYVSNTPTIW